MGTRPSLNCAPLGWIESRLRIYGLRRCCIALGPSSPFYPPSLPLMHPAVRCTKLVQIFIALPIAQIVDNGTPASQPLDFLRRCVTGMNVWSTAPSQAV